MPNCAKWMLFLGLILGAKVAQGWDALRSDFLVFNEVVPVDRSWLRMQAGESTLLSYDVGLEPGTQVPSECRWQRFREAHPGQTIEEVTQNYFKECEKKIERPSLGWIDNYYRTMFVRLKVSEQPYLKRVLLRLPNGFQQPGLLAVKDLKTRRPLIIFRAGIFGNSIDIQAERHMIVQLFEQGPFNLLFLDSATSPETIKWNVRYSAGGLDEGLQNYQIAERLVRPQEPISKLIGGIHLLGVSMGGHSLWMTLALNQLNRPLFKSAVAFCPLVEFEKTFRGHQENAVSFFFMNLWAYLRLELLRERVAHLSFYRFLLDSFESVSKSYAGPLTDDGTLKFPAIEGFKKENYFQGNNLVPLIPLIQVPVTVFSSVKDHLVPFETNFRALETVTQGRSNFNLIRLHEGAHCTNPGVYDWNEFSEAFKDQFVSREPDLYRSAQKIAHPLPLFSGELSENTEIYIRANVGSDHLNLSLLNENKVIVITQVPISKLDWGTSDRIRSESEARALIRWARANMVLEIAPAPQIVWRNLKSGF